MIGLSCDLCIRKNGITYNGRTKRNQNKRRDELTQSETKYITDDPQEKKIDRQGPTQARKKKYISVNRQNIEVYQFY